MHSTASKQNVQNRANIMSTFAKEFKVNNLPVTSVKSKLGHTMGTAGMDQLWAGLGALESQKLSGICTIPKLADDVFKENLDFYLENREFELVNQNNAFSKVFAKNGLVNERIRVFVHRITCNGKKVIDRKVFYPFVTLDGSNKGFYVYEGAIITLEFK